MAATATLATATEPGGAEPPAKRRLALLRSGKALTGVLIFGSFVLLAVIGPYIAPDDPSKTGGPVLQSPSADHLLGTTQSGQDVLSQILVGARTSMLVGFVAATFATALAVLIGVTAGYLGGWADEALSMLTNIFLVIPALPLTIVLTGYLKDGGWFPIAVVISVTGWAFGARLLRAQTLSLRNRDYIKAARAVGERPWRIITVELVPNLGAIIISGFLFTFIFAILTEASLSFLGLGSLTTWSWGTTLYWAQNSSAFTTGSWWWYVPPGLCIALVGASLSLINFGADELLNPRLSPAARRAKRKERRAAAAAAAAGKDGVR
ncbi:ABC transporter permease [Yinghuangia seranimata]|uniref:ABC transporter permease n=1 Tax=Yinghuangia seranimata TaxID=408067 RepID=UPI00248D1789|nr:ABC transporter permease [Yinghuangia seranimata]MDI2126074.1 ABC transporter permease [Yinghuangia seranimata]